MRVGVTGSSKLNRFEEKDAAIILRHTFMRLPNGPHHLYHGDAPGVDRIAARVARNLGWEVTPIPPSVFQWDGEGGFKQRNKRIVQSVECLYAIHSPKSKTGGTIWTFEYAKRRGIPAVWFELAS